MGNLGIQFLQPLKLKYLCLRPVEPKERQLERLGECCHANQDTISCLTMKDAPYLPALLACSRAAVRRGFMARRGSMGASAQTIDKRFLLLAPAVLGSTELQPRESKPFYHQGSRSR